MNREGAYRTWILGMGLDSIQLRFAESFEHSGLSLLSRVLHNQRSKIYKTVVLYRHQMHFVQVAFWNIERWIKGHRS